MSLSNGEARSHSQRADAPNSYFEHGSVRRGVHQFVLVAAEAQMQRWCHDSVRGCREPICRVLPIAPSTYHERVAQRQDPTRLSARARQDAVLKPEIARVFAENFAVYCVRKVWGQLIREGMPFARCTVARLMREIGLAGVIRGKRGAHHDARSGGVGSPTTKDPDP
ncbi:hypothetical protein ACVWYO_002265 [Sphingomonas sp. UYP23]